MTSPALQAVIAAGKAAYHRDLTIENEAAKSAADDFRQRMATIVKDASSKCAQLDPTRRAACSALVASLTASVPTTVNDANGIVNKAKTLCDQGFNQEVAAIQATPGPGAQAAKAYMASRLAEIEQILAQSLRDVVSSYDSALTHANTALLPYQ